MTDLDDRIELKRRISNAVLLLLKFQPLLHSMISDCTHAISDESVTVGMPINGNEIQWNQEWSAKLTDDEILYCASYMALVRGTFVLDRSVAESDDHIWNLAVCHLAVSQLKTMSNVGSPVADGYCNESRFAGLNVYEIYQDIDKQDPDITSLILDDEEK